MIGYLININDIEFSIYKDDIVWGDGTHESTEHMMNLISKYNVKDKSVIDIGTGTGILSILCSKLGARQVLALDIDAYSIEKAKENFERNKVKVKTKVSDLTRDIEDKADIVLANLPAPVQVDNMKIVDKNLKEDGLLIISWWNKLEFEKYVKGFKIIEHIKGNEYDGYVLRKYNEGDD